MGGLMASGDGRATIVDGLTSQEDEVPSRMDSGVNFDSEQMQLPLSNVETKGGAPGGPSSSMAMAAIATALLFFSTLALVATAKTNEEVMSMYELWLVKDDKAYNGLSEPERRFEIFRDNPRFVNERNALNRSHTSR